MLSKFNSALQACFFVKKTWFFDGYKSTVIVNGFEYFLFNFSKHFNYSLKCFLIHAISIAIFETFLTRKLSNLFSVLLKAEGNAECFERCCRILTHFRNITSTFFTFYGSLFLIRKKEVRLFLENINDTSFGNSKVLLLSRLEIHWSKSCGDKGPLRSYRVSQNSSP